MVQLQWSAFLKNQFQSLGPLTRCKLNVNQENDHAPINECAYIFFQTYPKMAVLKRKKKVWPFSCLLLSFTCLHFLLNVLKMWLANLNLLTTIRRKNEQFNLYIFNVIYLWHVPCVVTIIKLWKKNHNLFHCNSFDHLDLQSLNDYKMFFLCFSTKMFGIWGV